MVSFSQRIGLDQPLQELPEPKSNQRQQKKWNWRFHRKNTNFLDVKNQNWYLLFLFKILSWLNPEKVGNSSGDDPRSGTLTSSKTSHGISDERPHVPYWSSPATSHWFDAQYYWSRVLLDLFSEDCLTLMMIRYGIDRKVKAAIWCDSHLLGEHCQRLNRSPRRLICFRFVIDTSCGSSFST